MIRILRLLAVIAIFFFTSQIGFAQRLATTELGIDEKLGQNIPLDLVFFDEKGDSVQLGQFINRPTILSLVYFNCPGICTPLINGLVDVLEKYDGTPGVDYSLLTISFDETDTPSLAAQKKKNYLASFRSEFPENEWHFLTGDTASIAALTDAVGFRYKRDGKDFIHPGLLTILAEDGKIIRYLFGITFLPFDLKMALNEALEGRPGPTIARVLRFCFSYDPEGNRYAFNLLKVSGTVILLFALCFVAYLVVTTRARRTHGEAK